MILFETESGNNINGIDPKTWAKLELTIRRCKYALMRKSVFIGNVLARLKICFTNDIDTMAVDDYGNIYISPKFALSISEDEVTAVLAHEAFHIINMTFFRKRGRDHELWNIATDYLMNMYLLQDGFKLPECGCNPVKKGDRWVIPVLRGTKEIKDTDITELSADDLYNILYSIAVPRNKGGGDSSINVGDVVYDETTKKYGVVTSINPKTNKVQSREIPESEVERHLK
jgi:hypothetical protein